MTYMRWTPCAAAAAAQTPMYANNVIDAMTRPRVPITHNSREESSAPDCDLTGGGPDGGGRFNDAEVVS